MKWKKIKHQLWELKTVEGFTFLGKNKKECLEQLERKFLEKFLGKFND